MKYSVIQAGLLEIGDHGVEESRPTSTCVEANGVRVLIDTEHPAADPSGFISAMRAQGFAPDQVDAVLFTHLHPDHFGHKDLFNRALFVFHQGERFGGFWFKNQPTLQLTGDAFIELSGQGLAQPRYVEGDPDLGQLGDNELYIRHIPGHTPGSTAIFARLNDLIHCWVGDTFLNRESFDDWEPPHCSWKRDLIYEHMSFIRGNADVIIPGHGPPFRQDRVELW